MREDIDESVLDMMLEDPGMGDLYGEEMDKETLRSILTEPRPNITVVRHPMVLKAPREGSRVSVEVEPDGMLAWMSLNSPEEGETTVTQEEIREALSENNVVAGINDAFIARLSANPVYDTAFIIARGVKAHDGMDGEVKYYFNTKRETRPMDRMDGTVDYKELNYAESVEKDDLLCEVLPSQKGTDGYTVRGSAIPAKGGVDKKLPAGKNTYASEDGTLLYAACDGEVSLKGIHVVVDKVLKVENVDLSTGNLRFIGSVEISGRICEGFTVKATGDIRVGELIEGADVSAGGCIWAARGIKGNMQGVITAGEDVNAPFIENINVIANGNIYSNVVMNSNLECNGRVEVQGKKGCIMGGSCKARQIDARQIGNIANVYTSVEIETVDRMIAEAEETGDDLMEQERAVHKLQELMAAAGNPDKVGTQKQLLAAIYRKNELSGKKSRLEEEIEALKSAYSFDIRVRELFPNVAIKIGEASFRNMDWNKGGVYFNKDDCIVNREVSS